jgi:hypothetical protein
MTEQHVLVVRDKVQRYLMDDFLTHVELDGEYFTARYGSARIFIKVVPWNDDQTIVNLIVPLLLEVPHSQDLYKHVALHAGDYIFGTLNVVDRETHCDVNFSHSLLGDFLDPDELKSAVGGMLSSAEDLDDELQAIFGGTKFHED